MNETLTIGITGHRDIIESEKLKEDIEQFFSYLCRKHKNIRLLSPLADGADRLVAKIFLNLKKRYTSLELIVPMPFNQERYMEDFDKQSKEEFLNYLNVADEIVEVKNTHNHHYRSLGIYVVEHSQILLALWDGTFNHKLGGTGDIVSYAQKQEKEVVHFLSQRAF